MINQSIWMKIGLNNFLMMLPEPNTSLNEWS